MLCITSATAAFHPLLFRAVATIFLGRKSATRVGFGIGRVCGNIEQLTHWNETGVKAGLFQPLIPRGIELLVVLRGLNALASPRRGRFAFLVASPNTTDRSNSSAYITADDWEKCTDIITVYALSDSVLMDCRRPPQREDDGQGNASMSRYKGTYPENRVIGSPRTKCLGAYCGDDTNVAGCRRLWFGRG